MFSGKTAAWAYPGAILDLDFANGKYTGGNIGGGTANFAINRNLSVLTEVNGGAGSSTVKALFAPDANGLYYGFNQYVLRITPYRGLWLEGANTNYCRNCRDFTAATWTAVNMTATNSNIPGADGGQISSAVKSAGGSGYVVGELIYLVGGGVLKVATLSGSAVSTVTVVDKGKYQIIPSNPVAQFASSASGTGATFTITWTSAASRITASAALGTIIDIQTLTSTTYIGSVLAKRNTGTGIIEMTINNGVTWTDITSQLNTSTFTKIEVAAQASLANTGIGFRITTQNDAIDVDFCQLENCLGSINSSTTPILTTGSSVTRGAEGAFFDDQSATTGYNEGWKFISQYFYNKAVSCLISADGNGKANCALFGTDVTFYLTGGLDGSTVSLKNGNTANVVTTSSNNGTYGLGNKNVIGFSLEAKNTYVIVNGTATQDTTNGPSTSSSDNYANTSHCAVGNNGAGTIPLNGPVQRMTFWGNPGPVAHMNFLSR